MKEFLSFIKRKKSELSENEFMPGIHLLLKVLFFIATFYLLVLFGSLNLCLIFLIVVSSLDICLTYMYSENFEKIIFIFFIVGHLSSNIVFIILIQTIRNIPVITH